MVDQQEPSDALLDKIVDRPTDVALAFRLGCELYEYFIWIELIWTAPLCEAEKRIEGFLVRSRRSVAEITDQLFQLDMIQKETAKGLVCELSGFEKGLLEMMDVEQLNTTRQEIADIDDFLNSGELDLDDFPCDESDNRDSLKAGLFDETSFDDDSAPALQALQKLKAQMESMECLAKQAVNANSKLLTFFRLGFEILRPNEPLALEEIFSVEPNSNLDDNELRTYSSRRMLLEDAREYHLGLEVIDSNTLEDGYDLRDKISKALLSEYEELEKYRLGLVLYPKSRRFRRAGHGESLSLASSEGLWSILIVAAPTADGSFVARQIIEDLYHERDMKPKMREGKEVKRKRLGNAIYRLNHQLSKVSLRFRYFEAKRAYTLVDES